MDESKQDQLRRSARREASQGHPIAALRELDNLIGTGATNTDDWLLTGSLLCEIGEFAQALEAFKNCLQVAPQHVEARYELGRALYKLGDADAAAQLLEQVAEETGRQEIWMGLATIAPAVPSYDHSRVRKVREKFAQLTRQAESPSHTTVARRSPRNSSNKQAKKRGSAPWRIGYISAHWHEANYMKPVWPLINSHDRGSFRLYLFDDGVANADAWHWLGGAAHTESIQQLDNRKAAQRISSLELDVLVDISAYSQPERLGLFVHRPAPIQMAWFNMYATSGFHEFDYIIGDRSVLRSDEQRYLTERCLQLPLSYLTFQTNHAAPDIELRSHDKHSTFAFGCLGTLYKISPQVIATWAEILQHATAAQLVLSARELKSVCNQQYLLDQFQRHGVASDRLTFVPPATHFEFLKHYGLFDVALDTFPYNGGTTTMEALWQGVPVLTFKGDRWASRTSHSLLMQSHLSRFSVASREEYVRTGIELATNPELRSELQLIRQNMRHKLAASRVCDSQMLAQKMEALYVSACT